MLAKLRPVTRSRAAQTAQRRLSAQTGGPKPSVASSGASKPPVASKTPPPPTSTPTPSPSSAADESSAGSGIGKLLLALVLSAPAGAAVYVKQNPEWNPEVLRGNDNWVKFRELVLGKDASPAARASVADRRITLAPRPAATPVPKDPIRSVDELSATIAKGQAAGASSPVAKKTEKSDKKSDKKADKEAKKAEKKAEKKDKKDKETAVVAKEVATVKEVEDKVEDVAKAAKKTKKKAEKAAKKEAKKAEKEAKKAEEKEVKQENTTVKQEVAKVAAAVVAAEVAAAESFEQKVDAATDKARQEIAKLADQAKPQALGKQIDKQIQSTTSDLLSALKSESDAAAADIETLYLKGIETLDASALSIRVAQLATEMKHRSKWEAVRLLESLRRMEEETQSKSAEVLRRQDELHQELLARELRLQEEILTRQAREEMQKLKKAYSENLARDVNHQRSSMLANFQRTFQREKKAIEERFAQALRTKSLQFQNTLTAERKARVAELEAYQAQLRALGAVLDSSSTYEAFSHQVHKTSVAALALSDRIEAAAPLRSEIRALREAARSDPFIEAAVKSLPVSAVEEGAPSVGQLQERFAVVKSVSHRAGLVPEHSGIVGQLFGNALSYLIIPPGGPIEGSDTDAVLSRAEFALKAGDIEVAVKEMKALSGLPAQVSHDWVEAAETRLAVEQTAKVIKAHVALLAASLS